MKRTKILLLAITAVALFSFVFAVGAPSVLADSNEAVPISMPVAAENTETTDNSTSTKAISAAALIGVVGAVGAVGMALSIRKSTESMARQPEAASKINSALMLGLVFIETVIIYALIVAILIIFVL